MALATQCPFCQTSFRVASDQLKLRDGLVRCGHCHEVFDGNAHLLADQSGGNNSSSGNHNWPPPPPTAAPTVITPAIARANAAAPNYGVPPAAALPDADAMAQIEAAWDMPPPSSDEDLAATIDDEESDRDGVAADTLMIEAEQGEPVDEAAAEAAQEAEQAPAAVWRTQGSQAGNDDFDAVLLPMHQSSPPLDGADALAHEDRDDAYAADVDTDAEADTAGKFGDAFRDVDEADNIDDSDDNAHEENAGEQPEFVLAAQRRQRRARLRRALMIVLSVILVFVAIGQVIYLERNRIALAAPQLKPLLAAACQPLRCTVGLQRQIDQLSIESNELQAATAEQPALTLNLLLRNRAEAALAWPDIELTLNDDDEKALIRRVFAPAEYLPAGQTVEAGMGANTEQPVKLTFTLTQAVASGYRVYLFYP